MKHYTRNPIQRLTFDPKSKWWIFRTYTDESATADKPNCHEDNATIMYRLRMIGACVARVCHDRDKRDDGTVKQPHWHYVVELASPRHLSTMCALTGLVEQALSVPAFPSQQCAPAYRYLLHLDNPEKFQYAIEDVELLNLTLDQYVDRAQKVEDEEMQYRREALGLHDLCEAYARREMTLRECIECCPRIAYTICNFEKMADSIRGQRNLDPMLYDTLSHGPTREQTPVVRDFQKTEDSAYTMFQKDAEETDEMYEQWRELSELWRVQYQELTKGEKHDSER